MYVTIFYALNEVGRAAALLAGQIAKEEEAFAECMGISLQQAIDESLHRKGMQS
jgi:hypothetical protein